MRRLTTEFLLASALWILGLVAYAGSLELPWFILDKEPLIRFTRVGRNVNQLHVQVTGMDRFEFPLERPQGGSFVWFAHPLLWVGWLFLLCRWWRAATIAGCLALLLALNVPLVF